MLGTIFIRWRCFGADGNRLINAQKVSDMHEMSVEMNGLGRVR